MKKINLSTKAILSKIHQQKRTLLSLSVLVSLFLVGCQKEADQSSATSQNQESVSSEASSKKSDSKEKEADKEEKTESKTPEEVHKLYQSTLDWYQEIVDLAKNKDIQSAKIDDPETGYVASIINDSNGENIQYAFYDINKDGQDELILRDQYVIIAIYTLEDNKPVLAKEGGVAGSGGERRILTIYDNGSFVYNNFHSPTPEAHAINYRITDDGKVEEIKKVDYDLQDTKDPAPLLGLENEKEVDIESLNWQDLAPTTAAASSQSVPTIAGDLAPSKRSQQGLDINQIQQGDFSTLAGTWRNGQGREMTIDQNGEVDTGETVSVNNAEIKGQVLWAGIRTSSTGAGLIIAPAGTQIVPLYSSQPYTDSSDYSRDRLMLSQDTGSIENPEEFYYRVD
ncbi:DUF6287 domain-containing protein [Aerococcus urinae]|uniref:DUF6287 domain-containing protein n=1 Tax=Aerococcus urinae TaxID=1376 RepID=A0A0X8FFQ7_9LACT|nr:DUF6287 domain-containing protein [Aerococcus urinae]AMB96494.1 hypothetical protein AWM73_08245 [Aerococcus urinae]MCY3032131.1 DUF6287 domain-containing protein [Aerococcus urinae]MCY3037637.1 DUF6287 domain-containing protein [Aerococcus urinae]MCY3044177.1 DUF6287 domain-containing protein [Aerococcus urinae]MCY3045697.1 DUF6287 domain-containing protein [Aerococcus urinae]